MYIQVYEKKSCQFVYSSWLKLKLLSYNGVTFISFSRHVMFCTIFSGILSFEMGKRVVKKQSGEIFQQTF